MGMTYAEAKACGIAHLWPDETSKVVLPEAAPPPSQFVSDGMNKTERQFWLAVQNGPFERVYREPFKLRLAGRTFYTIDFASVDSKGVWNLYEVKGFMRDDAAVKIKVAATLYPGFVFWLARRSGKTWTMQPVTSTGISPYTWCPDWLK